MEDMQIPVCVEGKGKFQKIVPLSITGKERKNQGGEAGREQR